MRRNGSLIICGLALLSMTSCFDPSQPNYQYFPDMYESVGYDTYAEAPFANGTAAQPVSYTHLTLPTKRIV